MSTRVNGPESPIIRSRDELVAYLEAGCKPAAEWRIGTEHEKFVFRTADHSPVAYEGDRGIRVLLESLRDRFGWDAVGYASVALELDRSVPDAFRELAERGL